MYESSRGTTQIGDCHSSPRSKPRNEGIRRTLLDSCPELKGEFTINPVWLALTASSLYRL